MSKKIIIAFLFLIAVFCLSSCSQKSTTEKEKEESTTIETSTNVFTTAPNTTSSIILTTEPPKTVPINEIHPFSDDNGVAWIRTSDKLCVVNTNGDIIGHFSVDYTVLSDFEGGFSVIDKTPKNGLWGAISASENALVIDKNGNIALDPKKEGYEKIENYDGIKEGSLILRKNFDTFDKSGDYYFHYDLNKKEEKEICSRPPHNDEYNFVYIGDGYYVMYLHNNNSKYTDIEEEILVFHNYLEDKTISFRENPIIKNRFDEYREWSLSKIGDYLYGQVSGKHNSNFVEYGFTFDIMNNSANSVSINDEPSVSASIAGAFNGDIEDGTVWNSLVRFSNDNPDWEDYKFSKYYDFKTDKSTFFMPNCSYECEIINYFNSRFLVETQNKNNTSFFTVIDWNMNPVFEPKKFLSSIIMSDNLIIYLTEDNIVEVMDLNNGKIIETIRDANIVNPEDCDGRLWIENIETGGIACYEIQDNGLNKILELKEAYEILSDFHCGLAAVKKDNSRFSVNLQGEEVPIYDAFNYSP